MACFLPTFWGPILGPGRVPFFQTLVEQNLASLKHVQILMTPDPIRLSFWGRSGIILASFWNCSIVVLGLFKGRSGVVLGLL